MANAYCTIAQFFDRYDRRLMKELSSDESNRDGNLARVQTALDDEASELESHLAGRYTLPLASVPAVLTKWVAIKAAARMFQRRNDKPKATDPDLQWAADWIADLVAGKVGLVGVARAAKPALSSSHYTGGESRFDTLFGARPSPTGPSRGELPDHF